LRFQATFADFIQEVAFVIVIFKHIFCGNAAHLLRKRITHDQESRHIQVYRLCEATSLLSKNCRHNLLFMVLG